MGAAEAGGQIYVVAARNDWKRYGTGKLLFCIIILFAVIFIVNNQNLWFFCRFRIQAAVRRCEALAREMI